ncbi:hypothetical protein DK867_23085 [Ochrobactrum sp. POC9]|uniref:hypothetical protein n=1 Tax=Ochrobactrum sp. POC9 TaxID=2203419 RepID=UPI000D707A8D|nr:hypothetical protein [Ochrobactrum sp. POC9]PWU70756.1 hypothetical protein DK867_23085 [Ochrobactrum sp. POC9]
MSVLRLLDWLRGSGEYAVTIPSMDGALKPNDELDRAAVLADITEPDNLVVHQGKLLFSSGRAVFTGTDQPAAKMHFDSDVTCLASDGDGAMAIGLDDGTLLVRGGAFDGAKPTPAIGGGTVSPTACHFRSPSRLVVSFGSAVYPPSRWKRDLMEANASGSIWEFDLAARTSRQLAIGLAWPNGLLDLANGELAFSESWRHRLMKIAADGRVTVLVDELPTYPARLSRASNGDVLLAGFAPRRQLVEFILREPAYKRRMMSEVPKDYWMAPALKSGRDFREPLQGGAIRHLGIMKPWAPTKSYGLVIVMDKDFNFKASLHSRMGGKRHGVTSCVEHAGRLLSCSKGGDVVLASEMVWRAGV